MFLEFENYFRKQYSNRTLASLVVFTLYVVINSLEIESFHNVFHKSNLNINFLVFGRGNTMI